MAGDSHQRVVKPNQSPPVRKSSEMTADYITKTPLKEAYVMVEKTKIPQKILSPEKMKSMHYDAMSPDYDADNHDPTFVCAFCGQKSHYRGLGDLFGPYWVEDGARDVWMHVDCAVWVPCVLLVGGGQVLGLEEGIEQARALNCQVCGQPGARSVLSCLLPSSPVWAVWLTGAGPLYTCPASHRGAGGVTRTSSGPTARLTSLSDTLATICILSKVTRW